MVTKQAATTTTSRETASGSKVIKGKAADRAIITVESTGSPPKASETPSASTEQPTVKDKRGGSDGDKPSGSSSKKVSEVSKASPGEGQDAGSSTSNVLEAMGHENGRGDKKITAEEPQGKKKAGSRDKGGGSRGRGRPGRPVKRKEEALEDELGGTPGEVIDEGGDDMGSEGSEYEHEEEEEDDEEEAYDPMEDEEFNDKKGGGKRGRKRGGAKGKEKGETDAMVPEKEENEAEEGVKEGG